MVRAKQAYANRTDLNGPPKLPIEAASGQPYGERAQQQAAQRQIPVAPPSAPTPSQSQPSSQGAPPAPSPSMVASPQPSSQPVVPGSLPPLDGPSQRPNESVTAGLPGANGPNMGTPGPPDPLVRAAAVLSLLGDTADPQTQALRGQIQATLANRNLP